MDIVAYEEVVREIGIELADHYGWQENLYVSVFPEDLHAKIKLKFRGTLAEAIAAQRKIMDLGGGIPEITKNCIKRLDGSFMSLYEMRFEFPL